MCDYVCVCVCVFNLEHLFNAQMKSTFFGKNRNLVKPQSPESLDPGKGWLEKQSKNPWEPILRWSRLQTHTPVMRTIVGVGSC